LSRGDVRLAIEVSLICILLFAVAVVALTRHPQWFG